MSTDGPPAAWYPDPHDPRSQRYWDGSAWTEHVAPATSPSPGPGHPAAGHVGPDRPDPVWLDASTLPPTGGTAPAAASSRGVNPRLLIGLAALAAVAVAVIALTGGGGSGNGAGTHQGRIASASDIGVHRVQLRAGDRVEAVVTPEPGHDVVLAVGATAEVVREAERRFGIELEATWAEERLERHGRIPSGIAIIDYTDEDGDRGRERTSDEVDITGEYVFIVAGYSDSTGSYDIEITIDR